MGIFILYCSDGGWFTWLLSCPFFNSILWWYSGITPSIFSEHLRTAYCAVLDFAVRTRVSRGYRFRWVGSASNASGSISFHSVTLRAQIIRWNYQTMLLLAF